MKLTGSAPVLLLVVVVALTAAALSSALALWTALPSVCSVLATAPPSEPSDSPLKSTIVAGVAAAAALPAAATAALLAAVAAAPCSAHCFFCEAAGARLPFLAATFTSNSSLEVIKPAYFDCTAAVSAASLELMLMMWREMPGRRWVSPFCPASFQSCLAIAISLRLASRS
eukprot:1860-Heterococcus_DN1.PRE.4